MLLAPLDPWTSHVSDQHASDRESCDRCGWGRNSNRSSCPCALLVTLHTCRCRGWAPRSGRARCQSFGIDSRTPWLLDGFTLHRERCERVYESQSNFVRFKTHCRRAWRGLIGSGSDYEAPLLLRPQPGTCVRERAWQVSSRLHCHVLSKERSS